MNAKTESARTARGQTLEPQTRYLVEWEARDIGYGVESGEGIYVYVGRETLAGKLELRPHDQWIRPDSPTIFLFEDEITGVVRLP